MDNFHTYLKQQLLEYVESERKRGVPLEQIEKVLLDAGHQKNIVDEVFSELEKEEAGGKPAKHEEPVEQDLIGMLKNAFSQFMAQATKKEVEAAKKDFKKTDTEELVEEVIEEARVIEEKNWLESLGFFGYLLLLALVILMTAGASGSEIINVVLGFLPAIINAFVSFLAIKLADNVPLYMFIPLAIASAFYALGKFAGLPFFQGMSIESLGVINFLFGLGFNVMVVYIRFVKPKSMKRRVL